MPRLLSAAKRLAPEWLTRKSSFEGKAHSELVEHGAKPLFKLAPTLPIEHGHFPITHGQQARALSNQHESGPPHLPQLVEHGTKLPYSYTRLLYSNCASTPLPYSYHAMLLPYYTEAGAQLVKNGAKPL